MRELKYRVYDKVEKCYSDKAFSIDQFGDCYVQDEDGYWEEIDKERYAIEQYTGLKDKNGKKIYEGDIVLDYYDGDDAFIVEWDKDTASFILTDTCGISDVSFDNFYPDKELEVIGNIHENPELLGKGK